jgi:uncharacterized protein YhbP (UPF0306 family)
MMLSDNKYLVLATSSKGAKPWAAPVFFVYDEKYNLYFLSASDSLHAKHILENPNVAVAVFDSTQPIGSSDGLQIEGKATIVNKDTISKVITIYCERLFLGSKTKPLDRYKPENYLEPAEFRFFKITVSKTFVTGVDRRVEVDLNE